METKELHMKYCPHCGDVKMFEASDARLKSVICRVCLNGKPESVAVDFEKHTFIAVP